MARLRYFVIIGISLFMSIALFSYLYLWIGGEKELNFTLSERSDTLLDLGLYGGSILVFDFCASKGGGFEFKFNWIGEEHAKFSHYSWNIPIDNPSESTIEFHQIETYKYNVEKLLSFPIPVIKTNEIHNIKLMISKDSYTMEGYIDDIKCIEYSDGAPMTGELGFRTRDESYINITRLRVEQTEF